MSQPAELSAQLRVLLVPGLHGSGAGHWQTRWQALYPEFVWVGQRRADLPELEVWAERVHRVLTASPQPTIIVAHSFGCLASLHCAMRGVANLRGLLLVAPADPLKFDLEQQMLAVRLRIPATVIASTTDPWMASARAALWATRWQTQFVNAGPVGHINADSALGDWPLGLAHLQRLHDACLNVSEVAA
ncbi:MAG: alpha/beta hydrolase [Burkholderiales bacterium]|nr:alpha/beta hydrolase [Burkholderiales bacterium]